MEFLIEILLDLVLEGSIEISSNKKVPKIIRYPLVALIVLFFAFVIIGILVVGILVLKNSIFGGIFIIAVSIILFVLSVIKFKKTYLDKVNKSI